MQVNYESAFMDYGTWKREFDEQRVCTPDRHRRIT